MGSSPATSRENPIDRLRDFDTMRSGGEEPAPITPVAQSGGSYAVKDSWRPVRVPELGPSMAALKSVDCLWGFPREATIGTLERRKQLHFTVASQEGQLPAVLNPQVCRPFGFDSRSLISDDRSSGLARVAGRQS